MQRLFKKGPTAQLTPSQNASVEKYVFACRVYLGGKSNVRTLPALKRITSGPKNAHLTVDEKIASCLRKFDADIHKCNIDRAKKVEKQPEISLEQLVRAQNK